MPGGDPDPPGSIRGWQVIAGVILGMFGSFWALLLTTLAVNQLFTSASEYSDDFGRASLISSLLWAGLGALLVVFPKTRQMGAGLLLGVSLGFIVMAGVCAMIGVG